MKFYTLSKITDKKQKYLNDTHLFELSLAKSLGSAQTSLYQMNWVRAICLPFSERTHNILEGGRIEDKGCRLKNFGAGIF